MADNKIKRKFYQKIVDDCLACPACHGDMNVTRYQCSKMHDKMIGWQDHDEYPIPDWCPLEDAKEPGSATKSPDQECCGASVYGGCDPSCPAH